VSEEMKTEEVACRDIQARCDKGSGRQAAWKGAMAARYKVTQERVQHESYSVGVCSLLWCETGC